MDNKVKSKLLQQIDILRRRFDKYDYYRDFTSEPILSLNRRINKLIVRYYKIGTKVEVKQKKPRKQKATIKEIFQPRHVRPSISIVSPELGKELPPYETPYPIIIQRGEEGYILIKLFDKEMEQEIKRNYRFPIKIVCRE